MMVRAQLCIVAAVLLSATLTQFELRAIAAEPATNRPSDSAWKSVFTAGELAGFPALFEEQKRPILGRLKTVEKNDGVKGVRSYVINLDRRIAIVTKDVSKRLEAVRLDNKPMLKTYVAWDKKRQLLGVAAEFEALKSVRAIATASEPSLVSNAESSGGAKQQIASANPPKSGAPNLCSDNRTSAPSVSYNPSFLGVSVGMTEAQAIGAACQANNNDVKVISSSSFYTHRAAKSYSPTSEFTRGDYTRASNAIGKQYKNSIRLCVGCSNKARESQTNILRQPAELQLTMLPNGKVYRIDRSVPRASSLEKPTYQSALTALQNGFGHPSFKVHTYENAVIGWRYPNDPARLESWFYVQSKDKTVVQHYRDEGFLFPKGYYSEPMLRRENPQTSYCMNAYFTFQDGGVVSWARYFLFEGPRAEVMSKIEGKSVEQIAREQASWLAPGYTKSCGTLLFASIGFPQAEYHQNASLRSTRDYGRDVPSGGVSMTMLDTASLEEWKSAERREVEAHIRSTKNR